MNLKVILGIWYLFFGLSILVFPHYRHNIIDQIKTNLSNLVMISLLNTMGLISLIVVSSLSVPYILKILSLLDVNFIGIDIVVYICLMHMLLTIQVYVNKQLKIYKVK